MSRRRLTKVEVNQSQRQAHERQFDLHVKTSTRHSSGGTPRSKPPRIRGRAPAQTAQGFPIARQRCTKVGIFQVCPPPLHESKEMVTYLCVKGSGVYTLEMNEMYECNLPGYLAHDLEALKKGVEEKSRFLSV